jgi:hypothetical protein
LGGQILDAFPGFRGIVGVLWQKDQAGRIATGSRELEVHGASQEIVGHLDQESGSVASVFVCPLGSAVIEMLQSGYRLIHELVRAFCGEVRQKGDSAGVVLETGVVQAILRGDGAF